MFGPDHVSEVVGSHGPGGLLTPMLNECCSSLHINWLQMSRVLEDVVLTTSLLRKMFKAMYRDGCKQSSRADVSTFSALMSVCAGWRQIVTESLMPQLKSLVAKRQYIWLCWFVFVTINRSIKQS